MPEHEAVRGLVDREEGAADRMFLLLVIPEKPARFAEKLTPNVGWYSFQRWPVTSCSCSVCASPSGGRPRISPDIPGSGSFVRDYRLELGNAADELEAAGLRSLNVAEWVSIRH